MQASAKNAALIRSKLQPVDKNAEDEVNENLIEHKRTASQVGVEASPSETDDESSLSDSSSSDGDDEEEARGGGDFDDPLMMPLPDGDLEDSSSDYDYDEIGGY